MSAALRLRVNSNSSRNCRACPAGCTISPLAPAPPWSGAAGAEAAAAGPAPGRGTSLKRGGWLPKKSLNKETTCSKQPMSVAGQGSDSLSNSDRPLHVHVQTNLNMRIWFAAPKDWRWRRGPDSAAVHSAPGSIPPAAARPNSCGLSAAHESAAVCRRLGATPVVAAPVPAAVHSLTGDAGADDKTLQAKLWKALQQESTLPVILELAQCCRPWAARAMPPVFGEVLTHIVDAGDDLVWRRLLPMRMRGCPLPHSCLEMSALTTSWSVINRRINLAYILLVCSCHSASNEHATESISHHLPAAWSLRMNLTLSLECDAVFLTTAQWRPVRCAPVGVVWA